MAFNYLDRPGMTQLAHMDTCELDDREIAGTINGDSVV